MESRVIGVLGGRDFPSALLEPWLEWAKVIYAADSGGDRCIEFGFDPILLGDMDSFRGLTDGLDFRPDPDQETSDVEKLLSQVAKDGHDRLVLLNGEGDRLDHVFATILSCARSDVPVDLVLRRGFGLTLRPGILRVKAQAPGERFSILPITTLHVRSSGARWELDPGHELGPSSISLSNRIVDDELELEVVSGRGFLTLERNPDPSTYLSLVNLS